MPVFKSGKGLAPPWCELEFFEVVRLKPGETRIFERVSDREKIIVGSGMCRIRVGPMVADAGERTNLNLPTPDGQFDVIEVLRPTTLVRMCGHWGDDIGGSGLFSVEKVAHPVEKGDPTHYEKETGIDQHYHDCDEYWIIYEGRGTAMSEGKFYDVQPGDCLAIGMGWHHDFPKVQESVKAVYFETTMEGQKRRGHLWNHTHGRAQPKVDRV